MKKIISLFVSFVLLINISACATSQNAPNADFTQFLSDFVVETAESDYITMHQYFEHPEEYGIDASKAEISLGSFENFESKESDLDRRFDEFHIRDLDKTQQTIYRHLEFISYLNDISSDEEFQYLNNIWSSMNGTHQILVQFFSEYTLREEQDIEPLLVLIQDVPRYVEDALEYSAKQAEEKCLMLNYDEVIEDCQIILNSQGQSAVVQELSEEIESLNLEDTKEEQYKYEVEEAINTFFYPSFQTIIDGLTDLKDKIQPMQGLANFSYGKKYYEYLVADATGCKDSIPTIQKNLANDIKHSVDELFRLNPQALSDFTSLQSPFDSIPEILEFLESFYTTEFPELTQIEYTATPLSKEQSQKGIMAYFLIPAIDHSSPYRIRYNEQDYGSDPSSLELYSTFAHEGLPGHMYQSQYNHEHFQYPIQFLLGNIGFTEGYATYIEMEALNFLDLDEESKKAYILNTTITNDYIALMDLSIHYDGLSLEEFTEKYQDIFGPDLEDIYNQLAGSPASFLSYYYGYYQIKELKEEAQEKLKDKFDPIEFHDALLQSGSVPFSIIKKNIEYYISKKR